MRKMISSGNENCMPYYHPPQHVYYMTKFVMFCLDYLAPNLTLITCFGPCFMYHKVVKSVTCTAAPVTLFGACQLCCQK